MNSPIFNIDFESIKYLALNAISSIMQELFNWFKDKLTGY